MSDKVSLSYYVAVFPSVSHVMKAEKILLAEKIPIKIIPVPKSISSDCGVCIRFDSRIIEKIQVILEPDFEGIEYIQVG